LKGSWEIAMPDEPLDETGASQRGHHAGVDAPVSGPRRRMSATRKRGAVLRLLKGKPSELVSRELGVTAAELAAWRDAFLTGGPDPTKQASWGPRGKAR
jgi:hypothetical protein